MKKNATARKTPRRASSRRKSVFLFFAVGLGLLLPLALTEIGLRIYVKIAISRSLDSSPNPVPDNPNEPVAFGDLIYATNNSRIIYRLKPGAQGLYRGAKVKINERGYRDDPLAVPKPPEVFRIVALGDSSMFGAGVNKEQSYIELLENMLQSVSDRQEVEIVNTAVPGYNAVQEVEAFHEKLNLLQPEAVVIQYDLNDSGLSRFLYRHRILTSPELFLRRLPDLREGRLVYRMLWEPSHAEIPDRYRPLVGWEQLSEAYARLARTCRERSILLIAIVPGWFLPPDMPYEIHDRHYEPYRELCQSLDIPIIETAPFIREFARRNNVHPRELTRDYPTDWHPSALGHAVTAKAIFPQLLEWLAPRIFTDRQIEEALEEYRTNRYRVPSIP